MTILAVAVVVLLALWWSQLFSVTRLSQGLRVDLQRGRHPDKPVLVSWTIDLSEGFIVYVLLGAAVWAVAQAVASSRWVASADGLPLFALCALAWMLVLTKVSPRGTTYWLGVEASAVIGLFLALAPHTGAGPLHDFVVWIQAVRGSPMSALVLCLFGVAWLAVAWLVFSVIRNDDPLLGLGPLALTLALEVINDAAQPALRGLVPLFLGAAFLLLLRLNLVRLGHRWSPLARDQVSARVSITGVRALAVILLAAFVLPPLTSVDISARFFTSSSRPQTPQGTGSATLPGSGTTSVHDVGYSERVIPGGTISRGLSEVLQVTNDYPGTVYWRGIDLYQLDEGNWSTGPHGPTFDDSTGSALSSTPLRDQRPVHGHVKVTGQPQFTVFWPGEPSSASVAYSAVTTESGLLQPAQALVTAYFRGGVPEGAAYDVVAMASAATEDELRQAGNQYPGAITSLIRTTRGSIDARVAELARRVTAGKTNAYDQASAIQSYLRGNFGYQLQVAAPPPGANAVDAFLFDTRIGYCEYFASAFGEMVRSLGIPVRLVNGYGPGLSPELAGRPEFAGAPFNSIRAADAHTWPEVYFPDYGWIAFEPTPDPTYPILTRGPGQSLSAPQRAAAPAHKATSPGRASVFAPALEGVGALSLLAAAVVGVLLLLAVGGTSPDDMEGPWRRLGWLGRRVGVERRQAETPLEYGRRLAVALPRQKQAIGVLVQQYSRQCYGRGSLEPAERETAVAAWRALRAALPRLLLLGPERLRVGLADGQA